MQFEGGNNIVMRIPKHRYEDTLHFYRDILLMDMEEGLVADQVTLQRHVVRFGSVALCLDCMEGIEESYLCLEIKSTDIDLSTQFLQSNNILVTKTKEPVALPGSYQIKDPAGTTILLHGNTELKDS